MVVVAAARHQPGAAWLAVHFVICCCCWCWCWCWCWWLIPPGHGRSPLPLTSPPCPSQHPLAPHITPLPLTTPPCPSGRLSGHLIVILMAHVRAAKGEDHWHSARHVHGQATALHMPRAAAHPSGSASWMEARPLSPCTCSARSLVDINACSCTTAPHQDGRHPFLHPHLPHTLLYVSVGGPALISPESVMTLQVRPPRRGRWALPHLCSHHPCFLQLVIRTPVLTLLVAWTVH
jgi:hypothetical protein